MKPALGRGLGSIIPQKKSMTEQVIPDARQEVLEIRIDTVDANPRQPRTEFSPQHLEDLIGSIKEHGVISPIVVTRKGRDRFELIAGERRLRASKTLGLERIPAIVRDATEQQKLELAIIENIQRHDLNPVEEAIAYGALVDEFGLTQEEVAKRMGKSRSAIANMLRLLDLPEEILNAMREGNITKSHARTLLAEPNPAKRDALFHAMLSGSVSVREAEQKVGYGHSGKRRLASKDPNIAAHEKRLRDIFGTKVTISEKQGKGRVSIDFYSKEELLDLLDRMSDL